MPYITVMYSTGPLFLSVIWKEYIGVSRPIEEHVRILMPDEYTRFKWSFFNISRSSSWHGKDVQTIFWMGKHWALLTVTRFVIVGVVGTCLWWLWSMWVMRGVGGKLKRVLWRRISGKDGYELLTDGVTFSPCGKGQR